MNLDRFAQGLKDPQEEKAVVYCDSCGHELYEGEFAYKDDEGFVYCSDSCYIEAMLKNQMVKKVEVHERS